jgi:hypothetical protein
LFQPEHEGYLTDTALLEQLLAEKLVAALFFRRVHRIFTAEPFIGELKNLSRRHCKISRSRPNKIPGQRNKTKKSEQNE